jgi:hypothetical protein
MISVLFYLLAIVLIAALLYWVVDAIPVQQPLNRWVKIAIVFIAAIAIISLILDLAGMPVGPLSVR